MALTGALSAVAAADGTFSTTGATNWNALTGLAVTLSGQASGAQGGTGADLSAGTSGGAPYFSATGVMSSSALLAQYGVVVGGGAGAAPSTSANLTYNGTKLAIANSANNISLALHVSNATGFYYGDSNTVGIGGTSSNLSSFARTVQAFFTTSASHVYSDFVNLGVLTGDAAISRGGTNQLIFNANAANESAVGGAGTATSRAEINKAVTAIADGVAKAVFTFTVPNAAHSASFEVTLVGSMGAGGAIGANESTQTAKYRVDIARTANLNAVATISAVYPQAAAASVAGANNIATTAALSAISGANNATNTFTVNVTETASAGSGTNHTCLGNCTLLNANSTGVTVA